MVGNSKKWKAGILSREIEIEGDKISIEADTEERVKAVLDVFKDKLIKRNVSLKHLDAGEPQLSGKTYRINCEFKEGITTENAKKIAKFLKEQTTTKLVSAFSPKVKEATSKVKLTESWTPIITRYNQAMTLTGGQKLNPDLDRYSP